MRFSNSGFLHGSIVPRPLRNSLKYLIKYFCFLGDENIFDFLEMIPRSQKMSSCSAFFLMQSIHIAFFNMRNVNAKCLLCVLKNSLDSCCILKMPSIHVVHYERRNAFTLLFKRCKAYTLHILKSAM